MFGPSPRASIISNNSSLILIDAGLIPLYSVHRSSIAKTPLRLSNNVGIIDSGYRGNLGAFVDNIHRSKGCDTSWTVEKHTRLFQICGPNLEPIEVEIVDSENDLGKTSRGTGGFGSTGI